MLKNEVIAIFDVGKTNKKLFLINDRYKIVFESSAQLPEVEDEDGDPCEDIQKLSRWIKDSVTSIFSSGDFAVCGVNFSAYGASFVHLDRGKKILCPLYNYLKPYPDWLNTKFYERYGPEQQLSIQTCSPALGSLNSGLQLFRLKYEKPDLFNKIRYSVHLPQYLASLLTNQCISEITSIGCHTALWDFNKHDYHHWVYAEQINNILPEIKNCKEVYHVPIAGRNMPVGNGLHDSSAALIPYLMEFQDPFILLSTGTWCIALNPFNDTSLTAQELSSDCLCYLDTSGKRVKASRLFAGFEHEKQVKRISAHFHKGNDYYKSLKYDEEIIQRITDTNKGHAKNNPDSLQFFLFGKRDLSFFRNYEEAYHQLIAHMVAQQKHSIELVMNNRAVKQLFVDGGFSNNEIYMRVLSRALPALKIYAAMVPQCSAIGAAIVMHEDWNRQKFPLDFVSLRSFN